MIQVRLFAQFGNQLFQYVIGKLLAGKTGLSYTPPLYFKDKAGKPVVWGGEPFFHMRPTPGKVIGGQPLVIDCIHYWPLDILDGRRPIFIRQGYFQRYDYYRPFKDRIRHELAIPEDRFVTAVDDAVYI